jgi:hypothetical protein
MFIENAKDILYIILAFSVLWLTIFTSWLIYSLITIVRNVNRAVQEVENKVRLVERFVTGVREKIEKSSSYLFIIAEGVKQAVAYLLSRKDEKEEEKD